MNPYLKLTLKSLAVFLGALAGTDAQHWLTGQISLFDGIALFWPGLVALGAYWSGAIDTTPAPWKSSPAGQEESPS